MILRASLAASLPLAADPVEPGPLLDPRGARVVLGAGALRGGLVQPVVPGAGTLFGPRGACLGGPGGPLFVCDTGHHRLLGWLHAPAADHAPADLVIGQPGFENEGRNGRGPPGAATLNVPSGVASGGGALAVADAWNHRVLLWRRMPRRSGQPADTVVGQADFTSVQPNRGSATAGAATLNGCSGVLIHDGRLVVADTGNRRVLIWNRLPTDNGAPADLVLGQDDFVTRDAGATRPAAVMRWPHGLAASGGRLFVADAGAGRVMAWMRWPQGNGAACDAVLGQADLRALDHNRGALHPTAGSLNMPYAVAVCAGELVVADTANSRLLGFDLATLATGARAGRLAGQARFHDKGDNRWRDLARDSLSWPYGIGACGDTLVVADSGNNRVLLWDRA